MDVEGRTPDIWVSHHNHMKFIPQNTCDTLVDFFIILRFVLGFASFFFFSDGATASSFHPIPTTMAIVVIAAAVLLFYTKARPLKVSLVIEEFGYGDLAFKWRSVPLMMNQWWFLGMNIAQNVAYFLVVDNRCQIVISCCNWTGHTECILSIDYTWKCYVTAYSCMSCIYTLASLFICMYEVKATQFWDM